MWLGWVVVFIVEKGGREHLEGAIMMFALRHLSNLVAMLWASNAPSFTSSRHSRPWYRNRMTSPLRVRVLMSRLFAHQLMFEKLQHHIGR